MYKAITATILMLCATANAEVVDSSALGFTLRQQVEVSAPPPTVWAALTDVARWWQPLHTYSNDARNLSLEPIVGGCFCEKLGLYGGIEHMRVLYAEPVKHLRLNGALGPLQELAVDGRLTVDLLATEAGTQILMTYAVGGYSPRPLSELAPIVDEVLGVQVERLGRFIDTGSPDRSE
jgi:uncharacterized protein YndB with AHSA1/START domain